MAVTYKPHKSSKTLLIGGQSVTTGTDGGLVGPFPKFSINREELSTGDGTYIGTKFSIEITGIATLNENDAQDITVKGQRQTAVQGETLTALQFDRDQFPAQGNGILEITPYGGGSNVIKFNDARLLSVSVPEQTDEEAGVQNIQYTFSFEAYKEASSNSNTGTTGSPATPDYKLSSAEETWDISENEGQYFFQSNNPENALFKVYTLTHTVSATGLKKYSSLGNLATDGEAWRQAQKWVKSRLKSPTEVNQSVNKDLMDDTTFWQTGFVPVNMDGVTREGIVPDLKDGTVSYRGYNHVRQISSDLGAGSYSVTETWILCDSTTAKATHDIEISIEDDKGPFVTVSVSVSIQGLNAESADSNATNAYDNAFAAYGIIKDKVFNIAQAAYSGFGSGDTLRNVKKSESFGRNEVAGTITYSTSFDDAKVSLADAISEDININYDNTEGLNKVIAKIPIIGKGDGPVIQDMNTTTIKIVSATLDAVMKKDKRSSPPTSNATTVLEVYKPTEGKQQSKTEAWNPKSGSYNLSISWEYI